MVLRVRGKYYKKIGLLIILLSLIFGGYLIKDTFRVYFNNQKQDELIAQLRDRQVSEPQQDVFQLPELHQEGSLITPELTTFTKTTELDRGRGDTTGVLSIPGINILLPIFEGVGGDNLFRGAATNKIGQVMGEGNYVLASHYMYDGVSLFAPLDSLTPGMKIYISDFRHVHVYTYQGTFNIEPTEGEVIADKGERELTLYTCTEVGDFREIYQATYDGYYLYDELTTEQLSELKIGE